MQQNEKENVVEKYIQFVNDVMQFYTLKKSTIYYANNTQDRGAPYKI